MNPLEPLPSYLSPVPPAHGDRASVPPTPTHTRSPAAGRRSSPPVGDPRPAGEIRPAASGRQPAGGTRAPLQASFRFEELARQIVVTLIRPDTREVVCQIPPEKILKLIVYLRQAVGTAVDTRA